MLELNLSNLKVKHQDVNNFRTTTSFPYLEIFHPLEDRKKLLITINYSHNIGQSHNGFVIKIEPTDKKDLIKNLFDEIPGILLEDNIYKCPVENIHEMDALLSNVAGKINDLNNSLTPVLCKT